MLRIATINDVEAIMSLENECMPHPWVEADIRSLITDDKKTAVVDEEDGRLVGYVGASFVLDEAEIGNICVAPSCRRQGRASGLLKELFATLSSMGIETVFLEVEEGNSGAVSLYEKEGFEKYSSRKDYYGQGRNALLYKISMAK